MSRNPGPQGHELYSSLMPARTPGTLGVRDAAEPGASAELGDTPGPLGVNDSAARQASGGWYLVESKQALVSEATEPASSGWITGAKRATLHSPYRINFMHAEVPATPDHSMSSPGPARADGMVPLFAKAVNVDFVMEPHYGGNLVGLRGRFLSLPSHAQTRGRGPHKTIYQDLPVVLGHSGQSD